MHRRLPRIVSWLFVFAVAVLFLLLLIVPATTGAMAAKEPNAPAGYNVFDRYPWDTSQQSSVRVTRTGRLYKAVYDGAGLTAYNGDDYHPALGAMNAQQRGALDFAIPTGTRVILSLIHI